MHLNSIYHVIQQKKHLLWHSRLRSSINPQRKILWSESGHLVSGSFDILNVNRKSSFWDIVNKSQPHLDKNNAQNPWQWSDSSSDSLILAQKSNPFNPDNLTWKKTLALTNRIKLLDPKHKRWANRHRSSHLGLLDQYLLGVILITILFMTTKQLT